MVWVYCLEIAGTAPFMVSLSLSPVCVCVRVCVCVCVCGLILRVVFQISPHTHTHNCPMGLDRANEQVTKKSIIRYLQMLRKTAIELHAVLMAAPPCWKNPFSLSWSLKFSLNVARICSMYILQFIVSVRKVDLVIIVALLAHYTATVMSCKGASYNSRELCADQFVLRWVLTWLLKEIMSLL